MMRSPIVMAADKQDPPTTDLYNPAVHVYPWAEDVYLAFPSMFRVFRTKSHGRDIRGLYAGSALIMLGISLISRGDVIHQYYSGTRLPHISPEHAAKHGIRCGGVFRMVQRLDGFVSADVDRRGGELVTPSILFQGNRLLLNAASHGLGEIWVEIHDANGKPIPGYTVAEAVAIDRNGTAQEVWWKGGPDVGKLAGKPLHLRLKLRSANLCAFQFQTR